MKPTEKQTKVIDSILRIIYSWRNTNDINSPTNSSDIGEFLFADLELGDTITWQERSEIEDNLRALLCTIQTL